MSNASNNNESNRLAQSQKREARREGEFFRVTGVGQPLTRYPAHKRGIM